MDRGGPDAVWNVSPPASDLARRLVVVVSPSVDFRLDVRSALRRSDAHVHLLRSLHQLRALSPRVRYRGVVLDARLLPRPARRDAWTRTLLAGTDVHMVRGAEEAVEAARSLVARGPVAVLGSGPAAAPARQASRLAATLPRSGILLNN